MDYNEYEKNKDRTYLISDEDDIYDCLEEDIERGSGLVYLFIDSKPDKYNDDYLLILKQLSQKFIDLGYSPKVSFNFQDLDIDSEELEKIAEFGAKLERDGGSINFNEDLYVEHSFEEVVDAKYSVDEFVEAVKAFDASPFERFIIVQNYVTSRVYRDNEKDPDSSRNLIKVVNGQDIVCVGYAAMMDYLLGELGIKCLSQSCMVYKKDTDEFLGNHVNNVVYLDDPKYGIKGWYYLDCWDSRDEKEEPFLKYTHSLIPLEDSKKLKKNKVVMLNGFYSALYSDEEKDALYEEMVDSARVSELTALSINMKAEFDDCYECLNANADELKKRRKIACDKLRSILKDENIDGGFFKNSDVPQESSIACFLANLMQEKPDKKMLEKSVEGLRYYKELKKNFALNKIEYMKTAAVDCDVYDFLDKFEDGQLETSGEQECLIMVEEKLQNIRFAKYLKKIIEDSRKSKPITLDAYRAAIENANIAQGAPIAFAKVQAKRAIDRTVRISEFAFEDSAQNCFRKEALRRREEEKSK